MKTQFIKNKLGYAHSTGLRYWGFAIISLSAWGVFYSYWLFFPMVLGLYVSFTRQGVLLDVDANRYCYYNQWFGLSLKGKWKPCQEYESITVFKRNLTTRAESWYGSSAETGRQEVYDIYLLNNSHRNKLWIHRLKNKETALLETEKLSAILQRPLVKYAPRVSSATRKRRRR